MAVVRNKRAKCFAVNVEFPSFRSDAICPNTFAKFSSEILDEEVKELPSVVKYEKHSGDYTENSMGIRTDRRQTMESVFSYNGAWFSDDKDIQTMILQAVSKYDPVTKKIDIQHLLAKMPKCVGNVHDFAPASTVVDDLHYLIPRIPELLDREVVPIEKPEWVDEAIACCAEASAARP